MDRPPKYEVFNDPLINSGFEIPPDTRNYRIGSARTLENDTLIVNYWPHGHLRATAARYTAYYPDGREELLLDVPRYDQSWQIIYKYKEPKLLPKGTRLEVSLWYDNTAERGGTTALQRRTCRGHMAHGPMTRCRWVSSPTPR